MENNILTWELLEQKGFPHINYGIEIPSDPLNQIRLIQSGQWWYPQLEQIDEITGETHIVSVERIQTWYELKNLYQIVYGKELK